MRCWKAFTLVQVLIVLAVVAVLAAIIFPLGARALAASKQSACLSQLHQFGLASTLYAGDFEDRTPSQTGFKLPVKTVSFGCGWAGKVYPYVKSTPVFRCSADTTTVNPSFADTSSSVISYGANENLTSISLSQAQAASKTVLFFEVANCYAQLSLSDEGQAARGNRFTKLSPSGDGVKGSLIDYAVAPPNGHESLAYYATGVLDNSENDQLADDFLGQPGRHSEGANYLALEGHAVYANSLSISAGGDAKSTAASQSSTGCPSLPGSADAHWPCAAGTGNPGHKLTFSKI